MPRTRSELVTLIKQSTNKEVWWISGAAAGKASGWHLWIGGTAQHAGTEKRVTRKSKKSKTPTKNACDFCLEKYRNYMVHLC